MEPQVHNNNNNILDEEEHSMDQEVEQLSQEELLVVEEANRYFQQRDFQSLRRFIDANHDRCATDTAKLKLVRLWEEGIYQDFAQNKATQLGNNNIEKADGKTLLSSSMRYKLRKKHPCPVALEQELRVKNARLPKNVHDGLNAWLKKHRENPYPNKAEKESLSSKLGITPQQVNRWFIQRRKMLRIRGTMYLGRGITDTGSGDEDYEQDDDQSMYGHESPAQLGHHQHLNHHDSRNVVLLVPHDQHATQASLLEKILSSSPRSSPAPQVIKTSNLCSGGTVEELPLTPPPSISGQSNPRSTPPEVAQGYTDLHYHQKEAPLDLTKRVVPVPKSSPVILEPVSQQAWRDSTELFYYKQQESSNNLHMDLDSDERDAVNALLTLARKN